MRAISPGDYAGKINLTDLLDRQDVRPFHMRVLILCVIIAMLDGFDTQAIAFVAPVLAAQWKLAAPEFGAAFAAGLLGLTIGALLFSPVADKMGRKGVLIGCTVWFGVFGLATAWSSDLISLLILRLLTGIGLGGAMPNIIAMTAEYAPRRLRATAVTVMFCGFPLGSVFGGVLAAKLIPSHGWESVFVLGGILPLIAAAILVFALPESVRFLVAHHKNANEISEILRKVCGAFDPSQTSSLYVPEKKVSGFTGRQLFSENRAGSTLLLWAAFFCNLLVMYFLVNWLPALLKQSGYPLDSAIYATSTLNMGGVFGGVVLGRLIDRFGPFRILGSSYAVAAAFIGIVGRFSGSAEILYPALFVVGIGVVGAQIGMNAVASSLYPTTLRATGIGWALACGRLGSILGPTVGGILLALSWSPSSILTIAAGPSLIAAISVFALGRAVARREDHELSIEPAHVR
jgi:AAHS family 4-hydroxybenzoate transporter-like MFS transporter